MSDFRLGITIMTSRMMTWRGGMMTWWLCMMTWWGSSWWRFCGWWSWGGGRRCAWGRGLRLKLVNDWIANGCFLNLALMSHIRQNPPTTFLQKSYLNWSKLLWKPLYMTYLWLTSEPLKERWFRRLLILKKKVWWPQKDEREKKKFWKFVGPCRELNPGHLSEVLTTTLSSIGTRDHSSIKSSCFWLF